MRGIIPGLLLVGIAIFVGGPALRAMNQPQLNPCGDAQPVPAALQLPAQIPPGEPVAVERTLLDYLSSYRYRELGWCVDKNIRDTGPFLHGITYGTHMTVRIYYSPEVMAWLRNGRRGAPADGAVIIKEQYGPEPARYFAGTTDPRPTDWTIMIRRSSASHDGWFWGEVFQGMFDSQAPLHPYAGFGLYCLRCHASAERALTFSSLENIRGYPGEPIAYRVDSSWQPTAMPSAPASTPTPPATLGVQTFPSETLDTFLSRAHDVPEFMTSDQCMGCHSGAAKPPWGPTMWAHGANISEYGEWRWSPMALAGRDPVFYAQLESEVVSHDVSKTCMSCHGVMGARTFAHDFPGKPFPVAAIFDATPPFDGVYPEPSRGAQGDNGDAAYAGLARDGVSCTVCHHAVVAKRPAGTPSLPFFLNHVINGQFETGASTEAYGPFHDDTLAAHPMKEALGITPRFSAYTESSQMCGSCHTINLPVLDAKPHATVAHNVEQATYLEWLNSKYQNEYHPLTGARSCQACHMPEGAATKIALVQDQSYPETTFLASRGDVLTRTRTSGFRRHELLGLNAMLLSMFREFPGVTGVRTPDYMSGATDGLDRAIANIVAQAQRSTATVAVRAHVTGRHLIADVEIVNLTGHRFPTGVGFRRAFLDVEVRDSSKPAAAAPIFASGRSDARGRILGANGLPLRSESFAEDTAHHQAYQEHYNEAHPITSGDQAQIFEELAQDARGRFTTSFLRRDHEVKDNRILPIGWTLTGPAPDLPPYFLKATFPKGRAASDPRYADGKGHAIVRYVVALPYDVNASHLKIVARLYYQSFAPYFLDERTRGSGPAAQRLAALVANLDLRGTALDGWHLLVGQGSATVSGDRKPSRAQLPQARRTSRLCRSRSAGRSYLAPTVQAESAGR